MDLILDHTDTPESDLERHAALLTQPLWHGNRHKFGRGSAGPVNAGRRSRHGASGRAVQRALLWFLCLEALRAMIEVWVEVWECRPHTSEGPYYRPDILDRLGLTAADDAKKLQFQINVFGLKVARIVPKGVVHDH